MKTDQLTLSSRTTAIIRRSALAHNVQWLRSRLPAGTQIMAVVKANAYGHGAALIAPVLQQIGVDAFGVAATAEAKELRDAGVVAPVYLLSPVLPDEVEAVFPPAGRRPVDGGALLRPLSPAAVRRGGRMGGRLKGGGGSGRLGGCVRRGPGGLRGVGGSPRG